jgi:hypothetical protein
MGIERQSEVLLAAPPSGGPAPSHEQLRKRAVQWLTGTMHCGVVLSEIVSAAGEIPDAIGWKAGFSYVVECKASRSDWRANAHKMHERAGQAVGRLRYFLCPRALVQPEEVTGGWGLLWLVPDGRRGLVHVVKKAEVRESYLESEVDMLVSALRRVKAREFLVLVQDDSLQGPARGADATRASNSSGNRGLS